MDIIDRFQKSLTEYNRAKNLMAKGRIDEAEYLLKNALSHYPREALMDGAQNIDDTILDSYETLFSDIKLQMEIVDSLKGRPAREEPADDADILAPPPRHSGLYTKLQDVVTRNIERQRDHRQREGIEPLPHMPDFSFEDDEPGESPQQQLLGDRREPTDIEAARDMFSQDEEQQQTGPGPGETPAQAEPPPGDAEPYAAPPADEPRAGQDSESAPEPQTAASADDLLAAIADASAESEQAPQPDPGADAKAREEESPEPAETEPAETAAAEPTPESPEPEPADARSAEEPGDETEPRDADAPATDEAQTTAETESAGTTPDTREAETEESAREDAAAPDIDEDLLAALDEVADGDDDEDEQPAAQEESSQSPQEPGGEEAEAAAGHDEDTQADPEVEDSPEDKQIEATVEDALEREAAAEREEKEKLPDETVDASRRVAGDIAKSLNKEPGEDEIMSYAEEDETPPRQDESQPPPEEDSRQTQDEQPEAPARDAESRQKPEGEDTGDEYDVLVEMKEDEQEQQPPEPAQDEQSGDDKEEFPRLEPEQEPAESAGGETDESTAAEDKETRQPAPGESMDALSRAATESSPDDEDETLKFEEETQKKPGFFSELMTRLSYIFSRSKKQADEEPDVTEADTSETHKPEEPQQAESADEPAGADMPDQQQPEPTETQTEKTTAAEPAADEVLQQPPGDDAAGQQEQQPADQTDSQPPDDEDDEDEALLSDEELEAQKTPPKKEPVFKREFSLSNTIATSVMMLLFAATAVTFYYLYGFTTETTALNKVYQQAEAAAEKGNIDKATVSLSQYMQMLEGEVDRGSAMAAIIAGWASDLRAQNNPNDAVRLLTTFRRKGISSQAVSEELLGALIARSAASFNNRDYRAASDDLDSAGDILDSAQISPARASFFRQQIAEQAYVLYVKKAADSLAAGNPSEAYNALSSLEKYEGYLEAGNKSVIDTQVRKTADALAQKAGGALDSGDTATAKDLASKAVELDPGLWKAKNILRRAR